MNKRNKVGAAFLTVCLAVPVVQAGGFDADTVAFYPFTDKAVGETAATGDAITNAVDASTCEGSVKLMYDEIRLTRKILEPSEFLVRKRLVSGVAIIVR